MSDKRKHHGPKVFGGYALEGWKSFDGNSFHVRCGGADFLVHGDTVQDAIATRMENGLVSTRARFTGTTAAPALKAAILEAVQEWESKSLFTIFGVVVRGRRDGPFVGWC
jgi:hypothetical protein